MSFKANDKKYQGESKFTPAEPLEVGTYPGRAVQLIALGLQPQKYLDEVKDPKYMMRITYELSDEFLLDEDGNELKDKPRWISEEMTINSLDADKAKSTQRYFAIDPDNKFGGDFAKLIGEPCMISVKNVEGKGKNKGKIYNNVGSVQSVRSKEADRMPGLVNTPVIFDWDEPVLEIFLSQPEFIQDKIKAALDYEGSALESLVQGHTGASKGGSDQNEPKPSEKASQPVSEPTDDEEEW